MKYYLPLLKCDYANSTNKNFTGFDGKNIRHLKHLRPLAIRYLTRMYKTVLNINKIPHLGKHATIIVFLYKKKKKHWCKLLIHITFITHCQITRENAIAINNKKHSSSYQYGFKRKHSKYTALHNICHQITKDFNNPRQQL